MNYKVHLDTLKKRHQRLDMEIHRREVMPSVDSSQLYALKKKKLHVKEEIQRLSMPLLGTPKIH